MNKFIGVTLLLISQTVSAASFESWQYNRSGLKKFQQKSFFPAYQDFLKALENDPFNPEVQLNIARTFEANEEWPKAEKAYRGALKIFNEKSQRRFEVLFNLAGVLGKQKRIDEALAAYQQALEIEPDSIEVKTNIELLWQSGGGGGSGDQQKPQDDKGDQQQQGQNDQPQPDQQKKPQPKPFQSQDLSQDDVKRILDEIKNQEQGIRAQDYDKGSKEAPRAKDW